MKMKTHKFVITAKTTGTRELAYVKILTALALRSPDTCALTLRKKSP